MIKSQAEYDAAIRDIEMLNIVRESVEGFRRNAVVRADSRKVLMDSIQAIDAKRRDLQQAVWAWDDNAHNPVEPTAHTINGAPIDDDTNPGTYGRTHDMDCPGCVASGSSFTTSPRSETYWSS